MTNARAIDYSPSLADNGQFLAILCQESVLGPLGTDVTILTSEIILEQEAWTMRHGDGNPGSITALYQVRISVRVI